MELKKGARLPFLISRMKEFISEFIPEGDSNFILCALFFISTLYSIISTLFKFYTNCAKLNLYKI